MTIEITTQFDKWLRADLVETDKPIKNLCHYALNPFVPLMSQYYDVIQYVRNNYPEYSKYRIVSSIGASAIPHGTGI